MINNKTFNIMEYLALMLVMSYFIFHSILLVIIGILYSIYFIYKDTLQNYIKKSKLFYSRQVKEMQDDMQHALGEKDKSSRLSLVEKIEETGFIPSLDKKEDNEAA
tara:strand:- start:818 stop:1135 length:318 start_codon:yes stop_codon:yes gene_type:complete